MGLEKLKKCAAQARRESEYATTRINVNDASSGTGLGTLLRISICQWYQWSLKDINLKLFAIIELFKLD